MNDPNRLPANQRGGEPRDSANASVNYADLILASSQLGSRSWRDGISPVLVKGYRWFAALSAASVVVMGVVVLYGWAVDSRPITSLFPAIGQKAIPFVGQVHSTASICLIFASASLLFSLGSERVLALRYLALLCAMVPIFTGIFNLYLNLTGSDVEGLRLFQATEASQGITFPSPMATEDAITSFLVGISLILPTLPINRSASLSQLMTLFALPIPLIILFGAATQMPQLCALGGCFTMSTGFAIMALLLASAVFVAKPDVGYATMLSSVSMGGALLRRGTILFFFIPVLLIIRALSTHIVVNGFALVEPNLSWVLFVLSMLILVIILVVSGATSISIVEQQREDVASRLLETQEELERTRQSHSAESMKETRTRYKRVCLTCTHEYEDEVTICPLDGTPLSRIVDESLVGTVFVEKYDIHERLGSGGMSTVYKARHMLMDRIVAIKVLKDRTASSQDSLLRFRREAKATAGLNHPGIVGINDFGLAPDGRAFLVMDYLEGESLSEYLQRHERLDLPTVLDYATQICDALQHAHDNNVVHRDLKPSNIMLIRDKEGRIRPKIVDFGLAKIIDDEQSISIKITQTGETFGSPLYMSPEQCLGNPTDTRADIYALGCIFFECLAGFPPIMGKNSAETIRGHVNNRPAAFPVDVQIPQEMKLAVYRALHKEKENRPQSARDFKEALLAIARTI